MNPDERIARLEADVARLRKSVRKLDWTMVMVAAILVLHQIVHAGGAR